MKRLHALLAVVLLATWMAAICWPPHGAAQPASVPTYHGHSDRSGNFVVPGLTWEKARSLRSDRGFNAAVSGHRTRLVAPLGPPLVAYLCLSCLKPL